MTPLQFPKKSDFSSPEYKKEEHARLIDFVLYELGRLLDQRQQLDKEIARKKSVLAELQEQG